MIRPIVTIDRMKRLATRLKKAEGITHAEALDKVAQQHGYRNFKHFLNLSMAAK